MNLSLDENSETLVNSREDREKELTTYEKIL